MKQLWSETLFCYDFLENKQTIGRGGVSHAVASDLYTLIMFCVLPDGKQKLRERTNILSSELFTFCHSKRKYVSLWY